MQAKQEAKELKESAGERLRYARIAKFAKVCSAKVCLAKVCLAKVCTVLFVCERLRGASNNEFAAEIRKFVVRGESQPLINKHYSTGEMGYPKNKKKNKKPKKQR